MIRIEKLHIRKFRKIIDLQLDLGGENVATCGPNGTGKSGVVDAIEFALTGNISRLSGQGTGDLSVTKHGPHVDFRNKPEQASVELEVSFPGLNGMEATIVRSVKGTSVPKVTPPDADILEALHTVSRHPEFVLSRRELIRYVISKPGDRAKEVQALLRLEDVEKLRGVLLKIQNATSKTVDRWSVSGPTRAVPFSPHSKSPNLPARPSSPRRTSGAPSSVFPVSPRSMRTRC